MAVNLPEGFQAAGLTAGIKDSGKPDLALIFSSEPLNWAYAATCNLIRASCVTRNRDRYSSGEAVQGIVINSGNANCATGEQGVRDNEAMAASAAAALGLPSAEAMLTASTGIIGHPLPMDQIRTALERAGGKLGQDLDSAAQAILTTDLRSKQVSAELSGGARITGMAKGSGMIHPNMATMLAFVMTDANISQDALREMWPGVIARSFNQVTVDGDTSPNDMALAFANPKVEVDAEEFADALEQVARDLARQIARDGEGATKLLTVTARGGHSDEQARQAARAVARSPLVKAAAHGNDPNWGRILIAVGSSSAEADPDRLSIKLQDTLVYQGGPTDFDAAALSEAMDAEDLRIDIDLAAGSGTGTAWGCDLSREYVAINADYHT